MVKSRTQKKSAKKTSTSPQELSILTNVATDYIKHWTRKQLGVMHDNRDASVCIPIKNGYKIGLFTLQIFNNRTCEVRDRNNEVIHVFENKVSAVLYSIYSIKRRYWEADEILQLDQEINKCSADANSLRRMVELSRARGDFVTVDSRLARLEMAETRLNLARNRIAKIHKTARLLKVWE